LYFTTSFPPVLLLSAVEYDCNVTEVQAVYGILDEGNTRTIQHAVECWGSTFTCDEIHTMQAGNYATAIEGMPISAGERMEVGGEHFGCVENELDKDT
jgi:hypothetical protein